MPDIPGDNGDNTISGGNGSDTINGMGGNDTISGGNGHDTIYGGEGDDEIEGGNGNDSLSGDGGEDAIGGGNGDDAIDGGAGDDVIYGGNGGDALVGGTGNDQLFGQNGDDLLTGGGGDDLLDGNNGFDVAYYSRSIKEYASSAAAGYLHVVHLGGAGPDGHDRLMRVERLVFADRIINLGADNAPIARPDEVSLTEDAGTYTSGAASVKDNDYDFEGDALTISGGSFAGTHGRLTLDADGTYTYALSASAQTLAQGQTATDSFTYTVSDNDGSDTGTLVFLIAGANDAPVANADTATTSENATILADVLTNDADVDSGAVLTVASASAPAGQGTAAVIGNQVRFEPGSDFDDLAVGESEVVAIGYWIADEHGSSAPSTLTVTVTGTNDGPVASADIAGATERASIAIDVLANDSDVDRGAVLTVTTASTPAGQGSATVVDNLVVFDPGSDFAHLAVDESQEVTVSYTIEDEHGVSASATVTVTVTNVNDAPIANPDAAATVEDAAILVDVLANDTDADADAIAIITAASVPAGQGTVTIEENQLRFDPGSDFADLAPGETAVVIADYAIEDQFGARSFSTLTITVEGRVQGEADTPTEGSDRLFGTNAPDAIDALGGDDAVFGRGGNDTLSGGAGVDELYGEGGDDQIGGGTDDDFASGGAGADRIVGDEGNDTLVGNDGDDNLAGGDGFDTLVGEAGADLLSGGVDDDFLSGGNDDDELSGDAGSDVLFGDHGDDRLWGGADGDFLDGGDGDDTLEGGEGNDFLTDSAGTNVLAGRAGDDIIAATALDGPQAIDGGEGNDTLRVYTRSAATTIATGNGRDAIEIFRANLGTTAIVVADFTTGADGDQLRLGGSDGTLLTLLSGWDGSVNPFGAGFLQLEQRGDDTVLQWDRDGSGEDAAWETLVVFLNTSAGNFVAANFAPPYDPGGAPLQGDVLLGTEDNETIVGTTGADSIDALGGDDTVHAGSGSDFIRGGAGADFLLGGTGHDIIDGGSEDDVLLGEDGDDELLGEAGSDSISGGAGNDQLSGGDGSDSLEGGEGDDALDGGDGNDFLVGSGADTLVGGLGDDTIRQVARTQASTVSTGGGRDMIELVDADVGTAVMTITDFTPGAGGDAVRLTGNPGALLDRLEGWDGSSNPFGYGFLRLQQSGADTLLQWDRDGSGSRSGWETLILFENIAATEFSAANFAPGYDPGGGAPAGQTISGSGDSDTLRGTVGADAIDALGGNDTVFAGPGADVVQGGDGADLLLGEADGDLVSGGNDGDQLWGGDGDDQLSGEAGNDELHGENGGDELLGGDGNDSIEGGADDDVLAGGDGDDFLAGGSGADVLTGGIGNDSFFLRSAAEGPDELVDFQSGSEKLYIFGDGFGGNLVPEGSVSLVSGSDPAASDAGGQFLFDTDDGRLLWDVDGAGSEVAVLIATLAGNPPLSASDFVVI